jgi:hypothetical protein
MTTAAAAAGATTKKTTRMRACRASGISSPAA